MNRAHRRRAAHAAKAKKKDAAVRHYSARARFEQDLRTALGHADIKLIAMNPGRVEGSGEDTLWVMTVYAGDPGRFLTIQSGRGPLADIAAGTTRAVREALAREAREAREARDAIITDEKIPRPAPAVPAELDEALRNAVPGDRVVLPPGVYIPPEQIPPGVAIVGASEPAISLSLSERIRRAQSGQP